MVSEVSINERKDLLSIMNEIIDVGKKVVERGLAVGSGGNLSFRVPGTDIFFITGTGRLLDQLDLSSFAQVDLNFFKLPSEKIKQQKKSYHG